jgi:hypothetical protein
MHKISHFALFIKPHYQFLTSHIFKQQLIKELEIDLNREVHCAFARKLFSYQNIVLQTGLLLAQI